MKKKLKPAVVKLGGSSLGSPGTLAEVGHFIKKLRAQAFDVVLVHGGGPAINEVLIQKGIKWNFIRGQRQTTSAMIDIIEDVLANQVNTEIVQSLRSSGLRAQGFSGAKDKLLFCEQADPELGLVGRICQVSIEPIQQALLKGGCEVPVLAPVGVGSSAEVYNINADWAAAEIARALQAEQLIFLTDQVGILDAQKNLIPQATPGDLLKLIESGVIAGGMGTKVLAMVAALDAGIPQVRVTLAANAVNSAGSVLTRSEEDKKPRRQKEMRMETKGILYGQPG